MLLGRDSGDLMSAEYYRGAAPFIHKTKLGWTLVGETGEANTCGDINAGVFKTILSSDRHFTVNLTLPNTIDKEPISNNSRYYKNLYYNTVLDVGMILSVCLFVRYRNHFPVVQFQN